MNENIFDKLDFGPLRSLLDNDDITDISYDNGGQIWIRSLQQGSMRVEVEGATPEFIEKLAFQCSNVMGTTFNNAKPFLDAESAELRLNFVHQSIATNGIALVIRKTPAKIRLEKEKLLKEDYFTGDIHDFLIKCVEGHCNIMVAGETGSGKTEFVKYLASHTKTSEKIITIEDTLELHLDKIFPQRDIVAMKTNNVASYSDVLVTCMRQNPKWILLSEVRSAEAVSAVRNSISSGHNILSTIHADKAAAIPYRLYSLMETDLDVNQFLSTIYRYIQLGVHIKAYYSKEYGKFHRELDEVCEFYVDDNNVPQARVIYQKLYGKAPAMRMPSEHLREYLSNQNIDVSEIIKNLPDDFPFKEQDDSGEFEQYDDGSAHRENVDNSNSESSNTVNETQSENMDTVNNDGSNVAFVENQSTVVDASNNVDTSLEQVQNQSNNVVPVENSVTSEVSTEVVQGVVPTVDSTQSNVMQPNQDVVLPVNTDVQAVSVQEQTIAPVEQQIQPLQPNVALQQSVVPNLQQSVVPNVLQQNIPNVSQQVVPDVQQQVAMPGPVQVVVPSAPVLPVMAQSVDVSNQIPNLQN